MNINFIIGICGNARSGKDTFCEYAKRFLSKKKVGAARAAFADELKADLDQLCREKIGISAFTSDSKEKNIIRPLLVTYGTDIIRSMDENWWVEKLERKLGVHQTMEILPIVTDVRYPNEMEWIQKKHNGVLVHVTRKGVGPANKEEKINNAILKKGADYRIMWPTFGEENLDLADKYVRRVMNKVFKTKIKAHG
jgi:hypothetical protein